MPGRILVAEDEVPIRDVLHAVLTDEGYRVETVGDGQEALEALAATRYDLVLSHVMMPRVDGHALARAMRADPALRGIPLILMSAAGPALVPEAPQAAFIPKPFDIGHVPGVVERVLESAHR